MQTANALLLIRCFTKYIIQIENECALLEQINRKPNFLSDSTTSSDYRFFQFSDKNLKKKLITNILGWLDENSQEPEEPCAWNEVPEQINKSHSASEGVGVTDSTPSSPRKRAFRRSESQDLTNEESESDLAPNIQYKNQESKTLYQLIHSLFELCTSIPVR